MSGAQPVRLRTSVIRSTCLHLRADDTDDSVCSATTSRFSLPPSAIVRGSLLPSPPKRAMAPSSPPSPISPRFALVGVRPGRAHPGQRRPHGFYPAAAAFGAVVAGSALAAARDLTQGAGQPGSGRQHWPVPPPGPVDSADNGLACDAARLAVVAGLLSALRPRGRAAPPLPLAILAAAALLLTGRAAVHTRLLASDRPPPCSSSAPRPGWASFSSPRW
jgi:hypothetical protein